jgi:hypothetical protein
MAFGSAIFLPLLLFAQDNIKEMSVNWSHKDGEMLFQFEKVSRYREKLMFDLVVHNTNKTDSLCSFFTIGDDISLVHDELGRGFAGSGLFFKTKGEYKFAPNEKEAVRIVIKIPEAGLRQINLQLGLFAKKADPKQDCPNPIVNMGFNFHKSNVDIKQLL